MTTVSDGTKTPGKHEIVQFDISQHYLTYFINADSSGLEPQDLKHLREFEKQFEYCHAICPDDTDVNFTRCDIHGLMDNCVTVDFEVSYSQHDTDNERNVFHTPNGDIWHN